MKLLSINMTNFGSTGSIMLQLSDLVKEQGGETLCCVPTSRENKRRMGQGQFLFGSLVSRQLHVRLRRFFGYEGCFSLAATRALLRRIREFQPDVIHMHNIHGSFVNLPMLFDFLKKSGIPVVWTLHDCWSMTGQCAHFTMANCDRWKTGCHDCTQCHIYPESYADRTAAMWKLKKKWFCGVPGLTVVTPSRWLAELAKESWLREYPVQVIHNGIDPEIFRPTESDFRKKYNLQDKKILLGVAFDWGRRKGLDVFCELSRRLGEQWQVVLVGTNAEIDKTLPKEILSIHRTHDRQEMAGIYTAADVFANPTREETYPTVNMEALACGTPVVTFRTGGSPEIPDETCGFVVEPEDLDTMEAKVREAAEVFSREACLRRAEGFDTKLRYRAYLELYEAVCREGKRAL